MELIGIQGLRLCHGLFGGTLLFSQTVKKWTMQVNDPWSPSSVPPVPSISPPIMSAVINCAWRCQGLGTPEDLFSSFKSFETFFFFFFTAVRFAVYSLGMIKLTPWVDGWAAGESFDSLAL